MTSKVCAACEGTGYQPQVERRDGVGEGWSRIRYTPCPVCGGAGQIPAGVQGKTEEVAWLRSQAIPVLRYAITPPGATLGRAADNDVCLAQLPGGHHVSAHHARIEWDEGRQRWVLVDLGSTNGVFVDGHRTGENVLYPGCQVAFGPVAFTFEETGEWTA